MRLLQSMVIAFSMYSKIPMPKVDWNEKNMRYAMCFFPMVGVVIGIIMQLLGTVLINSNFKILFFSAIMTIVPIIVTGGIHMDGFLDTMDALSSWGDREKKLQILKDSNSGAFAVIGMGCYLILSAALWSEIKEECLPIVALGYVLSRALSGYSVVTFPSARESGLAKTFQDGAQKQHVKRVMQLLIVISASCMLVYNVEIGAISAVCAILVFLYYKNLCNRQFGGITGDLAGYFLQMCELAILASAVFAGKGMI